MLAVRRQYAFPFILAVLLLLETSPAPAAEDKLSLKIRDAGKIEPIDVSVVGDMKPMPAFEVPPTVVAGDPRLFFVPTGFTWLCRADNPSTMAIRVDPGHCRRFSMPNRIALSDGHVLSPAEDAALGNDWVRSYAAVYSALRLPRPWRGHDLLTVLHGENKNVRSGAALYANTVDTNVDPAACASGYDPTLKKFTDCWPAYNAFVSMRLAKTSSAAAPDTSLDLGPIVWPTMGYRQGVKKTSSGLRHPSALLHDGYLYIFYTDTSQSSEEGRRGGVRVARMALPGNDASPLGPAIPYYDGGFSDTNPSLPPGFTKERIRSFYDQPGGKASELWSNSWQTVRFTVARLRGTHAFLGVEEYIPNNQWGVRLRLSEDLVHWSDPVAIPGDFLNQSWGQGFLHYPVFSGPSGQMVDEVDPDGFYLVGTTTNAHPVRQRLRIELVR